MRLDKWSKTWKEACIEGRLSGMEKCFTNPTLYERETPMIGLFLNIARSIKV